MTCRLTAILAAATVGPTTMVTGGRGRVLGELRRVVQRPRWPIRVNSPRLATGTFAERSCRRCFGPLTGKLRQKRS